MTQLMEQIKEKDVQAFTHSGKFHADSYRVEQGRMLFGDGSCTLKARTVSGSLTVE